MRLHHLRQIPISIKTPANKTITFYIESDQTVETVKSKIEEETGVPPDQQQLIYAHRELEDNKTICECHILQGQSLHLDFRGSLQITVQILTVNAQVEGIHTTPFDIQMSLKVSTKMRITHIMSHIEHQVGIPCYMQALLFNDMRLESDRCLSDYNIHEEKSILLHLIIETNDKMELEIEVETSSGTNRMILSSQATVREVKENVYYYDYEGYSPDQLHLFCGGMLLNDEKLLQDYMLTEESVFYLVLPEEIPVLVHILTGRFRELFICVKTTDTVAMMKAQILKKEHTTSGHQLFLGSTRLADNKTVAECRITATSTLHVVGAGVIPICIKTRTGKVFLVVKPSDTVQCVTSKISECEQIAHDQQWLIFHHQPLNDGWMVHKTLQVYHISAGATLHLAVLPNELELYISTPSGNTLTMICLIEDTIADIKGRIGNSEGVPVECVILQYGDNGKTLKEENIKPGTFLDVGKHV